MTFAWRPGSQHDVAATRGADSVLASDCRAHFGLPSTRRGCRICVTVLGHIPSTAGTFRKKLRKNSGKTPETLSERFLEFPSRVRLGSPKPYNSRHLRLPEHFQNSLPPSTAGDASFFRSGSGEGLSEPVMEFPAVLGVFQKYGCRSDRAERQSTGKQMRIPPFPLPPLVNVP